MIRKLTSIGLVCAVASVAVGCVWPGTKKPLIVDVPEVDAATLYAMRIFHAPLKSSWKPSIELKVCLDSLGGIDKVTYSVAKGESEVDAKALSSEIAEKWSYQQYRQNGEAVSVCAEVAPEELAVLTGAAPAPDPAPPAPDPAPASDPTSPPTPITTTDISAADFGKLQIAGLNEFAVNPETQFLLKKIGSPSEAKVRVCTTSGGTVISSKFLASTGFGYIDQRIYKAIRKTWKFAPNAIDGVAHGACSTIWFRFDAAKGTTFVAVDLPTPKIDLVHIAGSDLIHPADETMQEIEHSKRKVLRGILAVCIAKTGGIESVELIESTQFSDYDDLLVQTIKQTWRFAPFQLEGAAQTYCKNVTFIFSLK
jgi:hypothetical protein